VIGRGSPIQDQTGGAQMIIIVFNTQSVTICGLKRIDELSSDSWRDLLKIATQVLLSSKLEIVMD
jgi:hypothetical protein